MNKKITIIAIILVAILIGAGYFIMEKININKRKYNIENVSEFKYFVMKLNDKYGVIDSSGKTIIEAKYDMIEIPNPSKDVFVCYLDNKGIAINSSNKQLFQEYNSIEAIDIKNGITNIPFEKSVLKSEKNGKYGLIDLNGKNILNVEYDNIDEFSNIEGQLQVEKDGKKGIVNIKGNILVRTEYDMITSDGYYNEDNQYQQSGYIIGIKNQDGYKYGYINSEGKLILKLEYNDISRIVDVPYENGIYLIASKNGQYGVIKNNKNIISNEFQSIEFDETNDVFIIQKGKNYGVADMTGKIIIPVQNTTVQTKGEYIYIERNNVKDVYDATGNKAKVEFNKYIMPTSNENYKILINSEEDRNYYGVLGANNKQIINSEYLYIEYAFDNYFIACGQDGKLGVIDTNENPVVDFKFDLVQKIPGKNMIQTLLKETNATEIYSKNMKKLCEIENATIDIENEYIKVYSNKDLLYYDNEGNEINNTKLFPNNKLYVSVKDEKWGFIDANGDIKVKYEYDLATDYNQFGFASIMKDGKWGCIDSDGKIVIEPQYELKQNYSRADFIGEYIKVDNGFGNIYYTKSI